MYQHLLFNHDDYFFNREWAMKYMDYFGMEKNEKIDKIFELKNLVKYHINDEKLMKKDCGLIIDKFSPLMNVDCVCLLVKNYQKHYILLAETNPAMAKYYTPAIWWDKFKEGLDEKCDVDLEY
jgi:hypothetical protein